MIQSNVTPALRPNTPDNTKWNDNAYRWRKIQNNTLNEFPDFRCGANYYNNGQVTTPAAPHVRASLAWCASTSECNGYQVSRGSELSQWAGPLVGFLLPGLVFSMSIPRGWELTVPEILFELQFKTYGSTYTRRAFLYPIKAILITGHLLAAVLITTLETVRWVAVILTCAGPMLVGGLYEMLLDDRLLSRLQKIASVQNIHRTAANEVKSRRILITLLLGNLSGGAGNPVADSENFIVNASATEAKARLHSLLESQATFGTAVGAPVVFYIGAYTYTLLDASKNLGDNDTSHALALGIWYSIFVLVAIICGVSY